jgi:hypothetical protein
MEGQDVRPRKRGWDVTDSSAEQGPGAGRPAHLSPVRHPGNGVSHRRRKRHPARNGMFTRPTAPCFRTAGGRMPRPHRRQLRREAGFPEHLFAEVRRGGHGRRLDVGVGPRAHRSIWPQEQGVRQDHPSGWTPSRTGSRFPRGNARKQRIARDGALSGTRARAPGNSRRKKHRGESGPARGQRSAGTPSFWNLERHPGEGVRRKAHGSPKG